MKITIAEAARRYGCSRARIYKLIQEGRLTAEQYQKRMVVDLDAVHEISEFNRTWREAVARGKMDTQESAT